MQIQIRDLARRAVLLAVPLLLAACAQKYPLYAPLQTAGDHGYSEEQLSPTSYKVNYLAQATLSYAVTPARRNEEAKNRLDFAYDMALWRASELALTNGYSAFTVADRTNDSHISVDYDRGVVPYSPTFYPYGMYDNYPTFPYPGEFARQTTINASVSLTINFERDASKPGAFDAKETIARLKAQYPLALQVGLMKPATGNGPPSFRLAQSSLPRSPAPPTGSPPWPCRNNAVRCIK